MGDCYGTCVDLATEPNCGGCGVTCRVDQACIGATCRCPSPLTECSGACVQLHTVENCDWCGDACDAATQNCSPGGVGDRYYCVCKAGLFDCGGDGTCEDRQTDKNNCGYCGHVCPGNKECVAGDC